jgi:hypothetical protein
MKDPLPIPHRVVKDVQVCAPQIKAYTLRSHVWMSFDGRFVLKPGFWTFAGLLKQPWAPWRHCARCVAGHDDDDGLIWGCGYRLNEKRVELDRV